MFSSNTIIQPNIISLPNRRISLPNRRIVVTYNKENNTCPVSKKEHLRTELRMKLKKALVYCDYTKETNHIISDACNVLWDEIEDLSVKIKTISSN
jgi:hypothetical protein